MRSSQQALVRTLIPAVAIVLAGGLVGHGLRGLRTTDRFVTVKGVSERAVQADLALWPIRLVAADNDLTRAQGRLATQIEQIRKFLGEQGVDTAGIETLRIDVSDAYVNQYQDVTKIASRYVVNQTVMVRSDKPETILAASRKLGVLVGAGVVLSSGGGPWDGGPTFLFTRLNDIKPEMIGEATGRAREAAQQFARDSGARLGGMRRANQGVFEILPRDPAPGIAQESQLQKTVRVVTTIEFLLTE